ncbi:MAG: ComF family protein [Patescibacteria group bacterium]
MARGWDLLERGTHVVAERLLPLHCVGCEREGVWMCEACQNTLLFLPPVWQEGLAPVCGVAAVYPYGDSAVREAIHALKYRYGEGIMGWMGEQIAQWADEGGSDIVPRDAVFVPVPLHYRRYVTRGYNQAELLAHAFGRAFGVPVAPLLKRRRATVAQMTQSRIGRLQNIAGAFVADERACARYGALGFPTIVIVDDVTTTGATLAACARALTAVGATRVYGIAFAKEL